MLQHNQLIQRAIRDSKGRFTGKYEIVEDKRNKNPGAYVPGVKGWAFLFPFITVCTYTVLRIVGQI
jgi:hypothetical protein